MLTYKNIRYVFIFSRKPRFSSRRHSDTSDVVVFHDVRMEGAVEPISEVPDGVFTGHFLAKTGDERKVIKKYMEKYEDKIWWHFFWWFQYVSLIF